MADGAVLIPFSGALALATIILIGFLLWRERAVLCRPTVLLGVLLVTQLILLPRPWLRFPELIDEVEYTLAAERLTRGEGYTIALPDGVFPPRYPPAFSAGVLAPLVWVEQQWSGESVPRSPVILVLVSAVLLALVVAVCTYRMAGGGAAGLALVFLGIDPAFRHFSGMAMIDVPFTLLVCVQLLALMGVAERFSFAGVLTAGLCVASASAMRLTGLVLFLPLLVALRWTPRGARAPALLGAVGPLVVALGGTLLYQQQVFGSILRSGYHAWTSVPYDFPELLLSLGAASEKFPMLLSQLLAPAMCVALLGRDRVLFRSPAFRVWGGSLILVGGPLLLFHLAYFHRSERFFLPCVALLAIGAGAGIARLLTRAKLPADRVVMLMLLSANIAAPVMATGRWDAPSSSAAFIAAVQRHVPVQHGVVVSDRNPALLQRLLIEGTGRRLLVASRAAEYASKLFSLRPPESDVAAPLRADLHRTTEVRSRSIEPVREVLAERPTLLDEVRGRGGEVFFDLETVPAELLRSLPIEVVEGGLLGRLVR